MSITIENYDSITFVDETWNKSTVIIGTRRFVGLFLIMFVPVIIHKSGMDGMRMEYLFFLGYTFLSSVQEIM